MPSVDSILTEQSVLANYITDFSLREAQQKMALAVDKALQNGSTLVCEAGTGTGKTFAYLIPALLSRERVIISTGTKNLQDQLFFRDLPLICKALQLPIKLALLKGRANYLCHYRLNRFLSDGQFESKQMISDLLTVSTWSQQTHAGDIAELADIPESSAIWPYVTSTSENCLNQECPSIGKCCLLKARQQAQAADVIVINHHLFFADHVLKDTGFGELLPETGAIIFDEAHHLPEIASHFFGLNISSRQLHELADDMLIEYKTNAQDTVELSTLAGDLIAYTQQMRELLSIYPNRQAWRTVAHNLELQKIKTNIVQVLTHIDQLLKAIAVRSKGLENCWQRCAELTHKFIILTNDSSDDQIHWFENMKRSFKINHTPYSIAQSFQELLAKHSNALIFTSATLTINHDFSHFTKQLGLTDVTTLQLDSPFNYRKQVLLYVPKFLPEPQDINYSAAVVNAAVPVIKASKGRTFFLFTSHRALQEAAEILPKLIDYPLFVQGQTPKTELLKQYLAVDNGVLLGSSSFWQGVDVRGEALACVIIDKLPFASPSDPILEAKLAILKQKGGNPFTEVQLPQAVINLKQGIGRLIRSDTDYGVLMIADPRFLNSNYAKIFHNSLPPMTISREISDVQSFYTKHENEYA